MQHSERRTRAKKVRRFLGAMFGFASLSLAGTAQADYCYRHITNNRDVLVTLEMCNTSGDCGVYQVPAHSTVPYAIPQDNSIARVEIAGEYFRNIHGDTTQTLAFQHWRNEGAGAWGKLFGSVGDFCHISVLGGQTLSDSPWSRALTFNSPSNGDVVVNAEVSTPTPTRITQTPFRIAFDRMSQRRANHTYVVMQGRDFPGLWNDAQAAVGHGDYIYFFRDGWYMRYNIYETQLSSEYPLRVNDTTWPGLSALGRIDAAVNDGNGKVYFFGGGNYLRFDIATDRADPGYPRPVNDQTWPGMSRLGEISAATNLGNGKIMFFSHWSMLQYDIAADRADPGYPTAMNERNMTGVSYRTHSANQVSMAATWRPREQMIFYPH